jgi:deoxycytidylate deaminase
MALFLGILFVCLDCANAIIQVAFKRIVICDIKNDDRWNKSFKVTLNKFKEAGILVDFIKVEDLD